jgi:hypothetical protein
MKKRIFSFVLAFAMILSCVPIIATAATSGTCGNNLTWRLDNGTLTISGEGDMENYEYNGPWGSYDSGIINVVIENGVTSIGDSAFEDCWGLTSIITDGVTSIGKSAFYGCNGLTSITIPDSVTTIGDGAFASCSNLTSVTIPDSVTSIGKSAFGDCSSLTSVTIPNSITSIDSGTFSRCSSLTSITIPDSVTSIGSVAFSSCSSLTSITIPNSVTSIDFGAFVSCSSLTSITIPNSVTSIGDNAFNACSSLTSVTIPDSVTSIDFDMFRGCSSLTSISIPKSVKSIGLGAFNGCTNLSNIYYEGNEEDWNNIYISYAFNEPLIENAKINYLSYDNNTDEVTKDKGISVYIDNEPVTFDVPPQIINDRTMVPLRAIFEVLGASVDWNQETKTVTSTKGDTTVKLTIDSNIMYVNGNAVTLDTPACVIDDRTLVPVRAISESYNAKVDWDGDTKTVNITSN